MHARLGAAAVLWLTASVLFACDKEPPQGVHFDLELRAQSTDETPLADVRFWLDGNDLGITDEHGTARTSIAGKIGQAVTLTVACPPAYRTLEPHRRLVLRHVQHSAASTGSGEAARLELVARCEPEERLTAVVVRTFGPLTFGLPIKVRGEVVGMTQADGTAHLLLRTRPNGAVRVELDTQTRPELIPRNPVQIFQVGDESSILLFEQRLALAPTPRPTQHTQTRAAPRRVPYRID